MRTLGLLFMLCGLWLCFTILFAWPGAIAIALGVLMCIASKGKTFNAFERFVNGALGVVIGLSVAWAAIGFVYLATGGKPSVHPTVHAAQQATHAAAPAAKPLKHAKTTR